jgi:hypothetical protein
MRISTSLQNYDFPRSRMATFRAVAAPAESGREQSGGLR